jgi:hypothetical protein
VPGPAPCPPPLRGRAGHDVGLGFGVAQGFFRSLRQFPKRLTLFEDAVSGWHSASGFLSLLTAESYFIGAPIAW